MATKKHIYRNREREIIHFERACVDRFLDEGVREGEREE
jgi:hypothetical protein